MVSDIQSLTLFITHYQTLARMAEQFDGSLRNVHMRFSEQDATDGGDKTVTFLYEVGEGVAHRSYGLNAAKLAGLPLGVLQEAGRQSGQMEEEQSRKRLQYLSNAVGGLVKDGSVQKLEHFVAGLEQM